MDTHVKRLQNYRISYTIQDGEYEYLDQIVASVQPSMHPNLDWAYQQIAQFWAEDDEEEQQAIIKDLQQDDCTSINGGWRMIEGVSLHEIKPIRITVRGGLVQDVQFVPPDTTVEVWDYDIDGTEDELLSRDEQGSSFVRLVW